MYARIVQVPLKPEAAEKATAYFRDTVGPALKQQTGFMNSRFLVNSDTNRCLMVTIWESPEARLAAETSGFLQNVLQHMKPFFAGLPTVDYYEVAVQVA
ncbi:antibiotic biosynthesis monooxygenase [Fibrella sp. WM1]|uniref:antibiotic biosynthesis monooxygenase family protein n=1 Tax=Fibrella musci TaxID=3242485 RepID=UPI0035226D09